MSSTGKYWPEDGLEKTETCSNTRVLMIVCYCCVSTEKTFYFECYMVTDVSKGRIAFIFSTCLTLKVRAVRHFETPATIYQVTRRHIPEDSNIRYTFQLPVT